MLNFRGSEVENKPEVLHLRIECLKFLEESHASAKPARLKMCPAHLCQEAPRLRTTARKRSRTAAMQRQSKQRRGAEERNNERTEERKKERKKLFNNLNSFAENPPECNWIQAFLNWFLEDEETLFLFLVTPYCCPRSARSSITTQWDGKTIFQMKCSRSASSSTTTQSVQKMYISTFLKLLKNY